MKLQLNKLTRTGSKLLVFTAGLFLLTATRGWAQPGCPNVLAPSVDLEAVGMGANPTQVGSVPQQQTATITVIMSNNGPCNIPTGEALAQVTLSSVFLDLGTPLNFQSLCPGQWTLVNVTSDATQHNLFFANNGGIIPILGGPACGFTFDVKGKSPTPPLIPTDITLSSSLSLGATGSDGNGNNQNAQAQMVVTAFILPVVISDFNVRASSCNGIVQWKTASEDNVDRFEVEYSSNGISWSTVGTVPAKNSPSGSSYQYVYDQGTSKGYYRVKIIDIDGKVAYTKIASAETRCTGVKTVSMYPNPLTANQNLTVVASGYTGNIKGELVAVNGQVIRTYGLKNGTNTLVIDNLAQGTYMLRVTEVSSGDAESFRVLIVK
jgi:hypothetical protein